MNYYVSNEKGIIAKANHHNPKELIRFYMVKYNWKEEQARCWINIDRK